MFSSTAGRTAACLSHHSSVVPPFWFLLSNLFFFFLKSDSHARRRDARGISHSDPRKLGVNKTQNTIKLSVAFLFFCRPLKGMFLQFISPLTKIRMISFVYLRCRHDVV